MKKNFFVLIFSVILMFGYTQSNQNKLSYKFGDVEVILLSWEQSKGNPSILIGASEDMIKECLPQGAFPRSVNSFIVRMQEHTILIDAGFEEGLVANLHANNMHVSDVDIVLLTHMHGDHIGGLLSDGKARFPNVKLYLSQLEYDYWTNDEIMHNVPEEKRSGFSKARQVIEVYKDNINLFKANSLGKISTPLLSGVTPYLASGHTPGHTMYMIESEDIKLLVWGDLVNVMELQVSYPDVATVYDFDAKQASIARKKVFDYVSKNQIPVTGMHIAFPCMGKIQVQDSVKYTFSPF